jgi:hypothetical protein
MSPPNISIYDRTRGPTRFAGIASLAGDLDTVDHLLQSSFPEPASAFQSQVANRKSQIPFRPRIPPRHL